MFDAVLGGALFGGAAYLFGKIFTLNSDFLLVEAERKVFKGTKIFISFE
jgi:hypothetical protein